jgi:hypothetical protein
MHVAFIMLAPRTSMKEVETLSKFRELLTLLSSEVAHSGVDVLDWK